MRYGTAEIKALTRKGSGLFSLGKFNEKVILHSLATDIRLMGRQVKPSGSAGEHRPLRDAVDLANSLHEENYKPVIVFDSYYSSHESIKGLDDKNNNCVAVVQSNRFAKEIKILREVAGPRENKGQTKAMIKED